MAVVPTITNRSVLPQQQPVSPLSASGTEGAFGDQQAAALSDLGQHISEAGDSVQKAKSIIDAQDNKREFDALDSQYAAFLRTMTYGDGTAQNPGYLAMQGENAINAYGSTQQAIQDYRSKLLASASNNEVQNMFAVTADHRTNQTLDAYLSHLGQERINANNALTNERITQAQQDSRTGWADSSIIDRSNAIIQGDLTIAGRRNGENAEVTAGKIKDATSGNILGAITSAAAVDTNKAKQLMSQYASQLNGADTTKALTVIHSFETQATVDKLRQIELQKTELGLVQEKEARDFAARMYDPQHPLTIPEIMSSHLDAPQRLQFAHLVEQGPTKTDPAFYNGLFQEVAAGRYQTKDFVSNVLPFIGHGINSDDYGRLYGFAQVMQKIGQTGINRVVAGNKGYITGSTGLLKDPTGDGNLMLFQNDLFNLVQKTYESDGETAVNQLLDSSSQQYRDKVVPLVNKYHSSMQDIQRRMAQQAQGTLVPAGARPPGVPPNAGYSPSKNKWYWRENGQVKNN